jgi:hypothetical protein
VTALNSPVQSRTRSEPLLSDGAVGITTEREIVDLFCQPHGQEQALNSKQHAALERTGLPGGLYRALTRFLDWHKQKKAADRSVR